LAFNIEHWLCNEISLFVDKELFWMWDFWKTLFLKINGGTQIAQEWKKNSKFVQRKQNPKKLDYKRAPDVQEAMCEIENKIWGIILSSQFKQVRV